jgi:hypothetical protein
MENFEGGQSRKTKKKKLKIIEKNILEHFIFYAIFSFY